MQAGSLAASDVREFSSRVVVNGVERPHLSWSVDRGLSGDLPAQVVASSGITQATGSIEWAAESDVDDGARNPWNGSTGWLPKKGDRVEIFAGEGPTEWKQFHGLIDEVTGSIGGGFQSTIIDDFDRLSAPFSHDPLLRLMPPLFRGDASYRAVGLTHMYYVDAALRAAGFFVVPPSEGRQILSVPGQTSMWPERGVMTSGLPGGVDGGPWAAYSNGPDGMALSDFQNIYSPALSFPMTETVRFSMTVSPEHSGNTTMKAYYGATDYVELAVAGSRTAVARLNGTTVCSLAMGSAVRVSLLVKAGAWTLRTNTGVTASGSIANPTSSVMDRIVITADGASKVAGFHVCHTATSTETLYTDFVPSARYQMDSTSHLGLMDAGPTIARTTCLDVLQRISEATLTAMWIDELGIFNWAPSIVLRARAVVRSVSTLDDVTSLSWSDSLLGARSRVEADHEIPAVSKSRWDNVLWHQGSTETMESGQVRTEFIEPPSGTDWIGLGNDYLILGEVGSSSPSNVGWGSVTGAVLADETTESLGHTYLTSTLEKINGTTYKLVHAAGSLPAGKKLELRYPSASTTIWARWLKQSFPLIRGFALTDWATVQLTGANTGPSWAPALTFDLGPWSSRDDGTTLVPQRIVDYLSGQTSAPKPSITGLEVVPDPRLQLGDVITIESPDLMGVSITALIVGISNNAGGAYTQSLAVRIINATSTFTTYAEYDAALAGSSLTYAQWQAIGPLPQTYAQFNTAA